MHESTSWPTSLLACDTQIRALTVADVFTREALAIEVGQRLKGEDVVRTPDQILRTCGKPKYLFMRRFQLTV